MNLYLTFSPHGSLVLTSNPVDVLLSRMDAVHCETDHHMSIPLMYQRRSTYIVEGASDDDRLRRGGGPAEIRINDLPRLL